MGESNCGAGGLGHFLVQLAAVERGQDHDVVTQVRTLGGSLAVRCSDGCEAVFMLSELSTDGSTDGLRSELDPEGTWRPAVPAPGAFPEMPLTPHEKWTELLEDVGGWHGMLDSIRPGLRLLSITRNGAVAEVEVGDGRDTTLTRIRLDDGELIVGLNDDIATDFDAAARRGSGPVDAS